MSQLSAAEFVHLVRPVLILCIPDFCFLHCFFAIYFLLFYVLVFCFFFFSSRRRHTRSYGDWSSDVCSSDLLPQQVDGRSCSGRLFLEAARFRACASRS